MSTAFERGWSTLKNGELLVAAEAEGFDVLLTTDTHLEHQQNLASRKIAVVVLSTTSWRRIEAAAEFVRAAVDAARPATYTDVRVP